MRFLARLGVVCAFLSMLMIGGCGGPSHQTSGTDVPITVLARNGPYPGTTPVRAATSLAQLKALLFITGSVPADCPGNSASPSICWPDVQPPPSSLLVAFATEGVNDVVPSLTATIDGTRLTLKSSSMPSSGSTRTTAVLEVAAVSLGSLPKAVLTVVAPPWDGPPWYGRALVDLRAPLPTSNLQSAVADLSKARDMAVSDARVRMQVQTWGIDALGVMHWPDDSLGCPGVAATNRVTTAGYVLFLAEAGVPVSRELEYHSDGTRTLFCGFSR